MRLTKRAHITSRPEYQVGDSVLGLCGKEFTVKVLWDDLPDDKPICRRCVDVALEAMSEADAIIEMARLQLMLAQSRISILDRALNPEEFALDRIAEADEEHQAEQQAKAEQEEKMRKTTVEDAELPLLHCTCQWVDQGNRVETDPNCPVHGAPIAPSEGEDA